jgi:hypothetical protein
MPSVKHEYKAIDFMCKAYSIPPITWVFYEPLSIGLSS